MLLGFHRLDLLVCIFAKAKRQPQDAQKYGVGWRRVLRAVLAVLSWHRQRRTLAPYLGQITWYLHLETPGCFFMCFLYYTKKLDEMSIRETLILGVQKPDLFLG
jgi:hypothetical protein